MRTLKLVLTILFVEILGISVSAQAINKMVILDEPGFPYIFELDPGESHVVSRSNAGKSIEKEIKLIAVRSFTEPNFWFPDSLNQFDYYQFLVYLEIEGIPVSLYHRHFQMPVNLEGLRIYIENIREISDSTLFGNTGDLLRQVRIAVCLENESWGPEDMEFPLNDYIWRSAVYHNTWSALVPFNQLYYHRGEDFGAIPNQLDVVAPVDGIIANSPLPKGDGGSNLLSIKGSDGIEWLFYHMDIESVRNEFQVGTRVTSGTVLGKTGMTWAGKKLQRNDPHLHVSLKLNDINLATFPYLMESYLRKYPDPVIAIAGGYRFTTPGCTVELDAERSFSRNQQAVKKVIWKLSNGETTCKSATSITYEKPGFYTEELIIESEDGERDRDFLYVKVYDPSRHRDFARGWAYYFPLRGNKPGTNILFWNRMINTTQDVRINFGDDPEWFIMQKEIHHSYSKSGRYVVTLNSTGPGNEPVILKMEVIVED